MTRKTNNNYICLEEKNNFASLIKKYLKSFIFNRIIKLLLAGFIERPDVLKLKKNYLKKLRCKIFISPGQYFLNISRQQEFFPKMQRIFMYK